MQRGLCHQTSCRRLVTTDRRGLFLLGTTSVYCRRQVAKDQYKSFKRTNFMVAPADTRIVYAAQGATF